MLDLGELGETVAWVRIQGEWMGRELEVDGSRDERNGGEGVVEVVHCAPSRVAISAI